MVFVSALLLRVAHATPLGLEEARIHDIAPGTSYMSKEVRQLRKMIVTLAKTGT
jgi:hypothetical protein